MLCHIVTISSELHACRWTDKHEDDNGEFNDQWKY